MLVGRASKLFSLFFDLYVICDLLFVTLQLCVVKLHITQLVLRNLKNNNFK